MGPYVYLCSATAERKRSSVIKQIETIYTNIIISPKFKPNLCAFNQSGGPDDAAEEQQLRGEESEARTWGGSGNF